MTRDEFSLPDAGFFRRVAAAAAAQTLPRFRQGGAVLNKAKGGFDPVTEADREAETAIRGLIRETFPGHGMLGEEFGRENGDSPFQWVIDPIDGTRAFISGLPLWGTLVGLTVDGRAVAGMMAQPFIGELFWADAAGAHYEGPPGTRSLSVRRSPALAEATLCTTTPALFRDQRRSPTSGSRRRCVSPATAPIATPTPWWRPAMSTSWWRSACRPTISSP